MVSRRVHLSAVAAAAAALLAFASPASAASHHPKGEFAPFAECPLSVITLTDCIHTLSNGGELKVGKKTFKLVHPVVVQGGAEGAGEEVSFYGAENGQTLFSAPQPLPGGLGAITAPSSWPSWLQEWFDKGVEEGQTALSARIELAAPATDVTLNTERLLTQEGTALGLPVKIRLESPLLGSNCHIGSIAKPVQLNFGTGTAGSVQGATGKVTPNVEGTLTTITGGRLVDGSYAAPAASGCGGLLSYFIDPLVNEVLGLPSPAGKNTAVLEGEFQDGQVEAVRTSQ